MPLSNFLLAVVVVLTVAQTTVSFSPAAKTGLLQTTRPKDYTFSSTGSNNSASSRSKFTLFEERRNDALKRITSPSSLSMTDPAMIMESTSSFMSTLDVLSNDNIKKAFSLATFGPQYLWILMVLFPNTKVTKKIMGGYGGIIAFSLLHLFIVVASASQENGTAPLAEFNGVFDPSPEADPQAAMIGMMKYPNFVSEEWSHVLTWDLFVGRWIWLDGIKRGVFTCHSVLLTNLIGPPGFLLHCATCLLTGKGIVGNEVPEDEEEV
jgi:hypothetical protein